MLSGFCPCQCVYIQVFIRAYTTPMHEYRAEIGCERGGGETDKGHHGRNKQTPDKNQVKMYPYNPITELPQSNKGRRLGNLILTASLSLSLRLQCQHRRLLQQKCTPCGIMGDHKLVLIMLNQIYSNGLLACLRYESKDNKSVVSPVTT